MLLSKPIEARQKDKSPILANKAVQAAVYFTFSYHFDKCFNLNRNIVI